MLATELVKRLGRSCSTKAAFYRLVWRVRNCVWLPRVLNCETCAEVGKHIAFQRNASVCVLDEEFELLILQRHGGYPVWLAQHAVPEESCVLQAPVWIELTGFRCTGRAQLRQGGVQF